MVLTALRARGLLTLLLTVALLVAAAAATAFEEVLPGSLVARWPLDVDALLDASPFRSLSSAAGGVSLRRDLLNHGAASVTNGRVGHAFDFNGTDGPFYLEAPLDVGPASFPRLTMGAWAMPRTLPAPADGGGAHPEPTNCVLSQDNGGFDRAVCVDARCPGGASWATYTGGAAGSSGYGLLCGPLAAAGTWAFVAAGYDDDAGVARLFVDGHSYTASASMGVGLASLRVGASAVRGSGFDGKIYDVFVYGALLTDGELVHLRSAAPTTPAPVAGSAGYALHLRGDANELAPAAGVTQLPGSYARVPHHRALGGFTQMTVALWVNPTQPAPLVEEVALLHKGGAVAGREYALSLLRDPSSATAPGVHGKLRVRVRLGSLGGDAWALDWKPANATVVSDGSTWTYLALTWDGERVALYANGTLVDERAFANNAASGAASSALFAGVAPVLIGAAAPANADAAQIDSPVEARYAGALDELRVWSTALPASVVSDVWEARHGVDVLGAALGGLVAYWKCDSGKGTRLVDASARLHNRFGGAAFAGFGHDGALLPASAPAVFVASGAPLGEWLRVGEDGAVVIALNGSDAGGRPIRAVLLSLPARGVLRHGEPEARPLRLGARA